MKNKKEMGQNAPSEKSKFIVFLIWIGGFVLGFMCGMALILSIR